MFILFVCTGNTCRSPMAAALLRHRVAQAGLPWKVESAGLYAAEGQGMSSFATDALIRRHVVVQDHASKPVTQRLVEQADLILTMTQGHLADLLHQFPDANAKAHALLPFVEGVNADIQDPFGQDADIYERCANQLDQVLHRLVEKLTKG